MVRAVMGSAGIRLVGMGFTFLVGIQLARGLGAEGLGVYSIAMSILALLTVFVQFGMPQLLTREVAVAHVNEDWGKIRGILRWSNQVVLVTYPIATLFVALWVWTSDPELNKPISTTLLAGLAVIPLIALSNIRDASLRGLQHIMKGQISENILRPALLSILLFSAPLMLASSLTPTSAMALSAVSAAASLLFSINMLRITRPTKASLAPIKIERHTWRLSATQIALSEGLRTLQGHLILSLIHISEPTRPY